MSSTDDVARFSALLRAKDSAERQAKTDESNRVRNERALVAAREGKDAAAQHLKQAQARARPDKVAAAQDQYKVALATLLELESGVRPTWAPAVPEPESVVGEVDEALQGSEVEGVTGRQDEVGDAGGEVGIGVDVGAH